MWCLDLAPVARRAPGPVVRGGDLPVPPRPAEPSRPARRELVAERSRAEVDAEAANHLRGHWGLFLDGLQDELVELRQACLDAEPGPDADAAYDRLRSHYDVMEWAAKEIDRHYREDRWRVAVDWAWDRGEHTDV